MKMQDCSSHLFLLWTGNLSRVYPASSPVVAGIGSSYSDAEQDKVVMGNLLM